MLTEMIKTFVLDTNVLLHDPDAIFNFDEHDVIIPIYVIEELDRFKREQNQLGRAARQCSRTLDALQEDGSLSEGVKLPGGGLLFISYTESQNQGWAIGSNDADTRIIAVALDAQAEIPTEDVILVSKDINVRIRADALGLLTEDYNNDKLEITELYTGQTVNNESGQYLANEFVHMRDPDFPGDSDLCRYSHEPEGMKLMPIKTPKDGVWGIRPRNKEQAFALDMLLDDRIKLVTLVGHAGTGKTLISLAAALHKVTEEGIYQRVLVSRPVMPFGKDIGYLPGTAHEKMLPWMQPIFDNVEFLMGLGKTEKQRGRTHEELIDLGILQVEPLTYIRGRSIPAQFMIVDEAQNLSKNEIFTILTRAGEGTKIVLTGDPYQIDNPYLDANNNGLVHVVNAFKDETIAGHITLQTGERSELAEIAASLI